jgi:hypothetical protein
LLSAGEIARGTQGALKFLRRDPTATFHFDNTPEACLRSFRLMVVILPLYVPYLMLFYSRVEAQADELEVVFVEVLRYVVDWLLFPVIFYEIARKRGWLERYPRYIGALNWINLPLVAIAMVVAVLGEIVPSFLSEILQLGLQVLIFYWFLMATRLALGASWPFSMLLLVVYWIPSRLLFVIVIRLLGLTPIPGA